VTKVASAIAQDISVDSKKIYFVYKSWQRFRYKNSY